MQTSSYEESKVTQEEHLRDMSVGQYQVTMHHNEKASDPHRLMGEREGERGGRSSCCITVESAPQLFYHAELFGVTPLCSATDPCSP